MTLSNSIFILKVDCTSLKSRITVLLGSDSATVLRPVQAGTHLILGEAYYDNVMDGEVLLGTLPKHFDSVL
jgi:hypothetical protein